MNADNRIFKRKLYERMLNWKHTKDGKTALLIKGARRVGKSTIAEEFAKCEYDSYIVVDFANAPDGVWEAVKNIATTTIQILLVFVTRPYQKPMSSLMPPPSSSEETSIFFISKVTV